MTTFFADPERYDLGDLVDRVLTMQTDCSWPGEAECLERHGLKGAERVLDIGTGNGYFLCRMAERYPEKQFIGVETSEPLVKRALETARERNLSNVTFIHDQCPSSGLKDKFDFIMARLAIYCSPNMDDVLAWSYGMLRDGARMAAIDLDYDWIYTYPPDPIIGKMFSIHRREFERHGADCSVGKKLPFLLQKAGFKDIACDVRAWWSSFELAPEQFFNLFSAYGAFSLKTAPDVFTRKDYDYLMDFLKRVTSLKTHTVVYPKFAVSGVRRSPT
jgi:ubiquinone/menaquinone biosynthesis C-methylase UbiE